MRGDRVRYCREQLGLNQEELAERIGVAVLQINRYENEKTEPNGDMIKRLAMALNVSSDYLLGLSDDPTPPILKGGFTIQEMNVVSHLRRGEKYKAIEAIVKDS